MSVLIKGIEMPTEKPMIIKINPDGIVNSTVGNGYRKYEAVPVPPHGRLIDADALERVAEEMQKQAEYFDERARQLVCESGEVSQYTWAVSLRETYRRFVKALEEIDAPTIIPADPAEEGET